MISFAMVSVLLLAYFIYMSTEDIKTKTVPVFPSNLLIAVFLGAYLSSCFYYRAVPAVFALSISLILLRLFIKRRLFIGSADAKALFVCFLASPYLVYNTGTFSWSPYLDPLPPALVYFFAAIPFIGYCIINGIANGYTFKEIFTGKKQRTAFFPFLLVGYGEFTALKLLSIF